MTVGKHYYSDSDMLRMQRDAEARVRDMQNRARAAAVGTELGPPPSRGSRNWNTNTGRRRNQPNSGRTDNRPERQEKDTPPSPPPPPDIPPPPQHEDQSPPVNTSRKEDGSTTIIEDIVGALGLDTDTLLIIGLILILINQKANTTLILALAYLLI